MNDKKDIYDIDNSQDQAIDQPDFRDYEYTEIYWDIDAINRQHFIYTGSNNGNWSQIWAGWMYKRRTDWKIVWHAFTLK